jgi:hypothetical protein
MVLMRVRCLIWPITLSSYKPIQLIHGPQILFCGDDGTTTDRVRTRQGEGPE